MYGAEMQDLPSQASANVVRTSRSHAWVKKADMDRVRASVDPSTAPPSEQERIAYWLNHGCPMPGTEWPIPSLVEANPPLR